MAATIGVLLSLIGNMATSSVRLSAGWAIGLWVLVVLMGIGTVVLALRLHGADPMSALSLSKLAAVPGPVTNTARDVHGQAVQAARVDKVEIHQHHYYPIPSPGTGGGRYRVGVVPPRADGLQVRAELGELDGVVAAGDAAVLTGVRSRVVSGLGGVGKTQLAAEYARTLWDRGDIDVLVWVEAMTREAVIASYADATAKIRGGSAVPEDAEHTATRWLEWLASTALRWLVVLDDLQDPADLRGLWPPHTPTGRIVVTTRRRDAALHGDGRHIIEVGLFTPAQAAAFLRHRLDQRPDQTEGAAELAETLGYLPLALAQAAAYIADHPTLTCGSYRQRFTDHHNTLPELLPDDSGLPDDHQVTVATTWSLSIDAADLLTPTGLARPLVALAAVLDPNGIPHQVFTAPDTLAYLSHSVGRDISADQAIAGLACLDRLSLITHTPTTPRHAIRVHALVQRAVREALGSEQLTTTARTAADALVHVWPENERDSTLAAVLRTNTIALTSTVEDPLWQPDAHPVLFRSGHSLGDAGQVAAAVNHFHKLATTARRHLGTDHPSTLTARNGLAYWKGQAGDPAGAVAAFTAVLTDRLRVLGPDHPDTLTTRHDLAYWQGETGNPAGAVAAFTALLTDSRRVLGPDHPTTLITRNNLAYWTGQAGDPAAALAFAALLTDRLRVLGPDHRDTLITRNDLAYWRGQAGDPAGAVAAFEGLLTDSLRVLGPEHPSTLITRHDLAYARGVAGDRAGAVAAFEALLTDRLRILGPEHPSTLITRHDLAYARGEAGDRAGAVAAFEALLTDRLRILGPEHPRTLTTRRDLAHWRTLRDRTTSDPPLHRDDRADQSG